jgi:hypothetical protein
MSNHKKNQNDAGDRDDDFFSNRGAIKNRESIHHVKLRSPSGAPLRLLALP